MYGAGEYTDLDDTMLADKCGIASSAKDRPPDPVVDASLPYASDVVHDLVESPRGLLVLKVKRSDELAEVLVVGIVRHGREGLDEFGWFKQGLLSCDAALINSFKLIQVLA